MKKTLVPEVDSINRVSLVWICVAIAGLIIFAFGQLNLALDTPVVQTDQKPLCFEGRCYNVIKVATTRTIYGQYNWSTMVAIQNDKVKPEPTIAIASPSR